MIEKIIASALALLLSCGLAFAQPSSSNIGPGPIPPPCITFGATAGTCLQGAGALGTPSSGTATNLTGLPISTGVSGLGTGVATLLSGSSSGTGGPAGTAGATFTGTTTVAAISGFSANLATTDNTISVSGSNLIMNGIVGGGLQLVGDGTNRKQAINIQAGASANIAFSTAGSQAFVLSGALTSCTGITTSSSQVASCTVSDKRLKNDLGIVSDIAALTKVLSLPAVHRYTFKQAGCGVQGKDGCGPGGEHLGFFAQDIQKVDPSLIVRGPKNKLAPDGVLQFDKAELGPLALAAIKAQQQEIDALKIQIDIMQRHRK
jgi:hypothetical protein